MAQALKVSATDFARGFTKYREQVQTADVIEVTAHGRTIGAYLSPRELEHYHVMKKREREVIRVSEMDDDTMALIMNAKYGEVSE